MRSALVAIALIVASLAGGAYGQPPIWRVRSAHAEIVLFGSVHLLPDGVDWMPPKLRQAVADADELWFELPLNQSSDAEAVALILDHGRLAAGDSLFNHLSEAEAGRLRGACQALQIDCATLASLQPWMADVTLSLLQDARAGAKPSQGVEQVIAAQAPAAVRRRAFETPAEQVDFLAGARISDQVASLDQTVAEIVDDPTFYPRLVSEWENGDLAAVTKDALDPFRKTSPALFDRLITERNRRWAATLAKRLRGRGKIVVVVGVGHLMGPGGVPALLRARGFAVEGP